MSARRPWKLYLLAILAIGLVAAIGFTSKSEKQETTSQWAMPEAASPNKTGNAKDPFPQQKKVLTPEEIRNGNWGNEEAAATEAEANEEKAQPSK